LTDAGLTPLAEVPICSADVFSSEEPRSASLQNILPVGHAVTITVTYLDGIRG